MPHKLLVFLVWHMGAGTVPSNTLGQLFPWSWVVFSHTCTLFNRQGQPSEDLWNSLSSPVLCPVNCSPLVFLDFLFHFLNMKTPSTSKLKQSLSSPNLFPVSKGSFSFLPHVWYLENYLIYFVWFFNCFKKEGKSCPCYSILIRRERYKYI